MEVKKKKNRPESIKYPPDRELKMHSDRGAFVAEIARLYGINPHSLKSYMLRRGIRINKDVKQFRSVVSRILRSAALVKAGYTEEESMKMAMIAEEKPMITTESAIREVPFYSLRHGHENMNPMYRYL